MKADAAADGFKSIFCGAVAVDFLIFIARNIEISIEWAAYRTDISRKSGAGGESEINTSAHGFGIDTVKKFIWDYNLTAWYGIYLYICKAAVQLTGAADGLKIRVLYR